MTPFRGKNPRVALATRRRPRQRHPCLTHRLPFNDPHPLRGPLASWPRDGAPITSCRVEACLLGETLHIVSRGAQGRRRGGLQGPLGVRQQTRTKHLAHKGCARSGGAPRMAQRTGEAQRGRVTIASGFLESLECEAVSGGARPCRAASFMARRAPCTAGSCECSNGRSQPMCGACVTL